MALFAKNKRGSLGSDSTMSKKPTPLPRSSIMTGLRGRDDAARMTQDMGSGNEPATVGNGKVTGTPSKAMVDSYLSSFNSVCVTSPRVEDYEDDVFEDDVWSTADPFRSHSHSKCRAPAPPIPGSAPPLPGSAPPLHPGTIPPKNKPPLQRLEDLPGLSIVTWEEFVESPSVLCGLFEVDRDDFIHYNAEQVNVFFHDSRMEQPTLGAASEDGLSWTIFIDSYNHLKGVRTWLTERVSIILLQLLRPKGEGTAVCLVAINPKNRSVGEELQSTFSRAIAAFLHQRNFSVELNLNSCVKTWCGTVLKMPCGVRGGRLVVTNGDESVPCARVNNVPYCVLCFPVWGIQKLSYRFKRRSDYEDFFLYFKAEDLALCTKSPKLKQYAETNNNNNNNNPNKAETIITSSGESKQRPWIKKNRQAVTAGTQTLDSEDGSHDRAGLKVEEVEDVEESSWLTTTSYKDTGRGKDNGFSFTSTSMDKLEPPISNGFPSCRPHPSIPPGRPKERVQNSGSKTNLLSESMVSASSSLTSSVLSPGGQGTPLSSTDPTPREGAHVVPVATVSLQPLNSVEEDHDDESLIFNSPRSPRTPRDDPRASGFDPRSTLPSVGSDDEHGNYHLLAETPSPRPDTPFNKRLTTPSLKNRMRPQPNTLAGEVIMYVNSENGDQNSENRIQLKGGTADLPQEPGAKQKKKRISKVLRDFTGSAAQQPPVVDKDEHNLRAGEGGLYARDNQAFVGDDESTDAPFKHLKSIDKVKYTPIKGLKDKKNSNSKAFPYTSELLDFVGENMKNKTSYSLVDQDIVRGGEVKKKKKNSAVQKKAEDMLFAPRLKLGEDRHDRNCLSDNDVGNDEDITDMEPDSVMSDVEGVASPRLIPVKRTNRTVTVSRIAPQSPTSDADTDWEITDCELDEEVKKVDGPKILAGAKGAQQLRATSAQRSRERSVGLSVEAMRRGGVQNDSRRRYIALNSLRRKANQLALQADLRRQKRPDSSSSSRLEVMDV